MFLLIKTFDSCACVSERMAGRGHFITINYAIFADFQQLIIAAFLTPGHQDGIDKVLVLNDFFSYITNRSNFA